MLPFGNIVDRAKNNAFFADIAKLSLGTVVGRAISVAILPILTRLYTPADFAVLATYLALLTPIAVIACLRFDVAIPMSASDDEAANVLGLALTSLVSISLLALSLVALFPDRIGRALGNLAVEPYLWLLPVGIALAGTYSAFQYWTTRMRRFGHIARTRISQSVLGVTFSVGMGMTGTAPLGLLVGNTIGVGGGGFGLAAAALVRERALIRSISPSAMRASFARNFRYPLYSTPEAFLNLAGTQLPILFIAAHAGAEAGFLLLGMQLMAAPMTLLGTSISQVYVSRAPEAYRQGTLRGLTRSIMRRLALVGALPIFFVGALAPAVIPIVFGAKWERAGEIMMWMTPWIFFQFIASPVSMVMFVTSRQLQLVGVRIVTLAARLGAVALALLVLPGEHGVEVFAVANALVYAFMAVVFLNASKDARAGKVECNGESA